MKINSEELEKRVIEGLISKRKHPVLELWVYNYTPTCQFSSHWDEYTLMCRGLVLDKDYNIIAYPFKKFFNIEEHESEKLEGIPNEEFEVYDKMDGSLGILFNHEDQWIITTRGSFESDQAYHANGILYKKYKDILGNLNKNHTYLIEILYPENKIVVDYNGIDDLILLAIFDRTTCKELNLVDVGFPIVNRYNGIKDFKHLKTLDEKNKEGFVLRFKNGFRVKIKFENYILLHKVITQLNETRIWEALKGNVESNLVKLIPDELYNWYNNIKTDLLSRYNEILVSTKLEFENIINMQLNTRKEQAIEILKHKYPHLLFGLLDGKDIEKNIWDIIKPIGEKL